MSDLPERESQLEDIARELIDRNLYMVLGTAGEDGQPWVTPVYYSAEGHKNFYWVSSPEAMHSRNIAARPEVGIVIFDSQTPIGTAQAVYMSGVAEEVTGGDIAGGVDTFSREAQARGAGEWTPEKVQPPAHLRLYRAAASQQFILCPRKYPGPCPIHGRTDDHRIAVHLRNDAIPGKTQG
jgi:nitroimidazol reductase NimA-like FMN-containing flavoprotein (pyridoxamine 5'-phosphate oxidase superfamily)